MTEPVGSVACASPNKHMCASSSVGRPMHRSIHKGRPVWVPKQTRIKVASANAMLSAHGSTKLLQHGCFNMTKRNRR